MEGSFMFEAIFVATKILILANLTIETEQVSNIRVDIDNGLEERMDNTNRNHQSEGGIDLFAEFLSTFNNICKTIRTLPSANLAEYKHVYKNDDQLNVYEFVGTRECDEHLKCDEMCPVNDFILMTDKRPRSDCYLINVDKWNDILHSRALAFVCHCLIFPADSNGKSYVSWTSAWKQTKEDIIKKSCADPESFIYSDLNNYRKDDGTTFSHISLVH